MVELKHGDVVRFFAGCLELGEIYSLACDTNHIITGHTLTNSAFKIWRNDNFEVVKVIKVTPLTTGTARHCSGSYWILDS